LVIHSRSTSAGSGGAFAVPLRGIQTSLLLGFFSACAFFAFFLIATQRDRASSPATLPTGWVLLCVVFLMLPFIACFFLLSRRTVESIAAAGGVACLSFGAFLLVSPFVFGVTLLLEMWGPNRAGMAAAIALLAFMAAGVAIIWFGARIGRAHWRSFGMGMGASALYVLFGFGFLGSAIYPMGRQAQRHKEQADMDRNMPGILANQRLLSLAACLFQNRMRNPQAGFPASLDPPPQDWKCDTKFAADVVPEHTLAYVAQPDSSGRITDFELTAVPKAKGVTGRNPIMIDNRGLLFVYYPWFLEDAVAKDMVGSKDLMYSQITFLKTNIQQYMKDKNDGLAPPALNADAIGGLGHERPSIEDDGMRLETRDYETRYFPPPASNAKVFALSAQCKSYGVNCLRSYFADYDGNIHATSEPRQATADDPLALRCEFAAGTECPDVDWFP